MVFWILVLGVVGLVAFIRLAPHDVERWHRQSSASGMGEIRSASGFVWRQAVDGDGTDLLRKLDAAATAAPRTTRLTGSIEDAKITYITRSRITGFPDYATIGLYEGPVADGTGRYLEINSRLRFGKSDLGVNRQRVKGWLSAL
jgi:hypothetical protein